MTQRMRTLAVRMRLGLVGVVVALVAGVAITGIWGPIWGMYGWRAVAAALMILEVFAFLALEALLRAPNPYSRLDPLYSMRDLEPTGELQSSDPIWLWHALPLVLTATVLLLTLRWL